MKNIATWFMIAILFTMLGYGWRMWHEHQYNTQQSNIQQSSLKFIPPGIDANHIQRDYRLKEKPAKG